MASTEAPAKRTPRPRLNPSAKEYKPYKDSTPRKPPAVSTALSPITVGDKLRQPAKQLTTYWYQYLTKPPPVNLTLPASPLPNTQYPMIIYPWCAENAYVPHVTQPTYYDNASSYCCPPPPPVYTADDTKAEPIIPPVTPELREAKPVERIGFRVMPRTGVLKPRNRQYLTPPRLSKKLYSRKPSSKAGGCGRECSSRNNQSVGSQLSPPKNAACLYEWREKKNRSAIDGRSTTVMIRNIPNKLSRMELIRLVGKHCKEKNEELCINDDEETSAAGTTRSEFDFLYLPFCFRRLGNRGYAFVNFTAAEAAFRFYKSWDGLQWRKCGFSSKKVVVVTDAMIQGKEELKKHFRKMVFSCQNDEFLPVELAPSSDGRRSFELISVGTRCDPCIR
ncbi:hypothetical protein Dimus_006811 [Dionaea muscipula]